MVVWDTPPLVRVSQIYLVRRLGHVMSTKKLENLLAQFNKIKVEIEKELSKKDDTLFHIFPLHTEKQLYISAIKPVKYFLITLTFDAQVSYKYDTAGQKIQLNHCLDIFRDCHYFACYEKHKSGILHSHIMIQSDQHDLEAKCRKILHYLTKTKSLSPAVNIKAIRDNDKDRLNTYNYIWDNKPDHPHYKDIIVNVNEVRKSI